MKAFLWDIFPNIYPFNKFISRNTDLSWRSLLWNIRTLTTLFGILSLFPRSLSGLKYINLTSTTAKIIFLFLTNWETINNQSSCSFMDLYLDDNVFLMTLNNIYCSRDWAWFECILSLWKSKLHQSNKKCEWLGLVTLSQVMMWCQYGAEDESLTQIMGLTPNIRLSPH